MTVVKFSILTLLAGGFCTLLGVGIWMGPQETSCNAQTPGVTTVAVAAPCDGCCSKTQAVAATVWDSAACDAKVAACPGGACPSDGYVAAGCTSGACEVVSAPVPSYAEQPCNGAYPTAPVALPQLPAATPYAINATCENGVCVATVAPCPTPLPSLAGPVCQPGMPCAPAPYPAWAPAQAVAPCVSPDGPHVAYPQAYPVAPAFVAAAVPAPVTSAYAYDEARGSLPSYNELLEAYFEERETRHQAEMEALQAQVELQLEAGEALAKAAHEVELAKIKAETAVQIADLQRAVREQEGLLRLVAAGTISQEALQTIVANCEANAGEARPVSTSAAACKCEKCGCATCKCGGAEATPVSVEAKCDGCACPACEKTVSVNAAGECKACAACEKSCEACVTCTKECGECTLTAEALEFIDLVAEGQQGCKIVIGQKTGACAPEKCGACTEHKACPASETCPAAQAEFVIESTDAPATQCKNCIQAEFKVTGDVPVLSQIPYIGKLFQNANPAIHYTTEDIQYFPPAPEPKAEQR